MSPAPATWPPSFPAPAALLAWLHELQRSPLATDKALHLAALRWLVLAELDRLPPSLTAYDS